MIRPFFTLNPSLASACLIVMMMFTVSCDSGEKEKTPPPPKPTAKAPNALFQSLPASATGVNFINEVPESEQLNYFTYPYIYGGGGVAAGDLDQDGLEDLYFTANFGQNRLYHNKGNLQFEDITTASGAIGTSGWTTGVSMIDINQDGLLDIYICKSGPMADEKLRANLLYMNQGNMKFKEAAAEYGLDDPGFSIQAYFFDYDKDGDLDCYLVNHRMDFSNSRSAKVVSKREPDAPDSDHLLRNDNGKFTNVTRNAGVASFAWGLSASIGDFNGDGWDDIYVANDFLEADFLYINNRNGTFSDGVKKHLQHIPMYAMGSDLADINNDGLEDLYVLDMMPEDHVRSKMLMAPMSTSDFWALVDAGLQYQYMTNTLQLNRGNGHFSEIGQMAGVAKTDWSWAPLFADFDNDGFKDLFVTNGIKRDVTDNDYKSRAQKMIQEKGRKLTLDELKGIMPGTKLPNHYYRNRGDLRFEKLSIGVSDNVNSNGVAYTDLDNDGDLELVLNNVDDPARIYKNLSNSAENHFLNVNLQGKVPNVQGIGARVYLYHDGQTQLQVQYPVRGYLSGVTSVIHFGMGASARYDSVVVQWPDGQKTHLGAGQANQTIQVSIDQAKPGNRIPRTNPNSLFTDATSTLGINHQHQENDYDDFIKEILLPHKQSANGPFTAVADVNGDGHEDFFVGGAAGHAGRLYQQMADGRFAEMPSQPWRADLACEDLGAHFFDADGDGDQDLYVVSGGNEFAEDAPELQDRLYLNDGSGRFAKAPDALPQMLTSGQQVAIGDIDGDQDLDLFVGGRLMPGKYPFPAKSYLLQNNGGKFTDITASAAADLVAPGLVTDAVFSDYDGDKDLDLVVVGEWLPIRVFQNNGGKFAPIETPNLPDTRGWWFSIEAADLDGDGDDDYVVGNIGENNKFHASQKKPLHVYCHDFDQNGTYDIVLAKDAKNIQLPVRGRQCSSEQMPFIKEKYPTFEAFATATLSDIYSPKELESALHYEARYFSSALLMNQGGGQFTLNPLPTQAQASPINGILATDLNEDGRLDLVLAGNMYDSEVETVRYDAGIGVCLLGDGNGGFSPMSVLESGFFAPGNVKSLSILKTGPEGRLTVLVGNNDGMLQAFRMRSGNPLTRQ